MSFIDGAMDLIAWLELSVNAPSYIKTARERYNLVTKAWVTLRRPDCNIETAYAFLKAWQYTSNPKYLTLSRTLYDNILAARNPNYSWKFALTDPGIYTNDNSEIPIFLFRMAEIDTERASLYIESGLHTTDFLLSIQNVNGSWRVHDNVAAQTPMFTAHAVSALSCAYPHTSNQAGYKTAIETALTWIATKIQQGGRIQTCNEINAGTEAWRPPSSEQAITIRAFALAEINVTDSTLISFWNTTRQSLLGWMNQLIDDSGAIRNGLGESITNADFTTITDHVYTTAFGVEAYYYSYILDSASNLSSTVSKILNFVLSNISYSKNIYANGCLRGAYNLQSENFDTHIVIQNGSEEGGGNMIYTGWANAPIAALLFNLPQFDTGTGYIAIANGEDIVKLPIRKATHTNNGVLRVYIGGELHYLPIVQMGDSRASNVRVYANGEIMALKRI